MPLFSKYFSSSRSRPASAPIITGSSVFSATGLPRVILAAMLLRDGLFGRESDLTSDEQAILQSRLGPIPCLRSRPLPAPESPGLLALQQFTDGVVLAGGRSSRSEEALLEAAGFTPAAVSEVVRVVCLVRDVFGLPPPRFDVAPLAKPQHAVMARAA